MRRPLLAAFFILLTITLAILATGGFTTSILGLRLSARSATVSTAAALVVFALWLFSARRARAIAADLNSIEAWIDRRARDAVLVIALLAAAVAVNFGSFSAGGSDASGYLSEAAMLSSGALSRVEPLALVADWHDAAPTLAPLGWRAIGNGAQVPTYAVGLPLVMALPHALGGTIAAALVVPIAAALMVWFGAHLAMLVAGGPAGVIAATWIATMPIAIFESVQPMSDVPVTAAWLACWWWCAAAGAEAGKKTTPAFSAGTAAAIAILIRPNLAPAVAVPALFLFHASKPKVKAALAFALPVLAAVATIAFLQRRWFGSMLRSGYGTASEIYSVANVAPNARLYLQWLVETHGPWLLAAPVALFLSRARVLRWMLGFAALVVLAYLVYSVFEEWSYLRFLLPPLAIAAVSVAIAVSRAAAKLSSMARGPLVLAMALAIATFQTASAREHRVFGLGARQSRALLAGRYLSAALPQNAVLMSGEQSGAMRYYTNRPIVRWDLLDTTTARAAHDRLAAAGYELWIALDDWEAGRFRDKFRQSPVEWNGLDWPPSVEAGSEVRTLAWRVRDRGRFLRGDRVATDRLR